MKMTKEMERAIRLAADIGYYVGKSGAENPHDAESIALATLKYGIPEDAVPNPVLDPEEDEEFCTVGYTINGPDGKGIEYCGKRVIDGVCVAGHIQQEDRLIAGHVRPKE